MAIGVKNYVIALSQEAVPAISRGLTAVKILAHIIGVAAFFFLGRSFDFSLPVIFGVAIVVAVLELILVVPYRLWAKLTQQVTPRIILSCSNDEPGCVRRDVKFNIGGSTNQISATWFRLKVRASGIANIVGCCAHLISIKRVGETQNLLDDDSVVRPFTPATGADAEKKTIRPTHPEYVDVITANAKSGIMWLYRTHQDASLDWKSMFAKHGKFMLTVALTSENSAPCKAELEFDWTGDPANSSLSLISQNPPA